MKESPTRRYGGEVKKIIEYDCGRYWADGSPIRINRASCRITTIMEFNPDEIKLKELKWFMSEYPNEPNISEFVKVDSSGLIIERISRIIGGPIDNEHISYYTYNDSGFETEREVYKNGNLLNKREIIYDDYNCPIREIHYDKNNDLTSYYINEFDNKNRKTLYVRYNNKDIIQNKYVMEYEGDHDDWTVRYRYDGDGNLLNKVDKRENKVNILYKSALPDNRYSNIEYYPDGQVKKWNYTNTLNNEVFQEYDLNGRIIERNVYNNNEWLESYTWKYREDGAILEESHSTSQIIGKSYYKKTTYFSVDFNGNWVEKYTMDSDERVLDMKIREIEYY